MPHLGRSDDSINCARIDSRFPSLLVFLHDIAEGSDARIEEIEERFEAFLLILRVGDYGLCSQPTAHMVVFRLYLMHLFRRHIFN